MRPAITPIMRATTRASRAAATLTWVAASRRENTSRPALSPPSRCSALGGASTSCREALFGSYGASIGPKIATSPTKTMNANEIAPSGRFTSRRSSEACAWGVGMSGVGVIAVMTVSPSG